MALERTGPAEKRPRISLRLGWTVRVQAELDELDDRVRGLLELILGALEAGVGVGQVLGHCPLGILVDRPRAIEARGGEESEGRAEMLHGSEPGEGTSGYRFGRPSKSFAVAVS